MARPHVIEEGIGAVEGWLLLLNNSIITQQQDRKTPSDLPVSYRALGASCFPTRVINALDIKQNHNLNQGTLLSAPSFSWSPQAWLPK